MDKSKYVVDGVLKELGLSVIRASLHRYLISNSPTDNDRACLEYLFEHIPNFVRKTCVFRAVRSKMVPKNIRNKYVGGCATLNDVLSFVKKRNDKGYKYILISRIEVECFDLYAFINYLNETYNEVITDFYQHEKEVVFKMSKGDDWFYYKKLKE